MSTGACDCSTAPRASTDGFGRCIPRGVSALAKYDDGLAQVIATPDLDGDGTRDLVAVSRYDGRNYLDLLTIYVDAISGKDGHSLWWWRTDFKGGHWRPSVMIWPPFLWGRGENGWPMLAVPLGGTAPTWTGQTHPDPHREPPRVHFLSLASGQELHAIDGLSWPRTADLDGDGLEDLWGSVDGNLRAYRGEMPEAWRALGRYHRVGDLDGDGIADVISDDLRIRPDIDEGSRKTLTAAAHSGRDGRLLWRSQLDYQGPWQEVDVESEPGYTLSTFALPGGDLDGDGAPEISVVRRRCLLPFPPGARDFAPGSLERKVGAATLDSRPVSAGLRHEDKLLRDREHRPPRSASRAGRWTSSCGTTDSMCRPAHHRAECFASRIAWPVYQGETDM